MNTHDIHRLATYVAVMTPSTNKVVVYVPTTFDCAKVVTAIIPTAEGTFAQFADGSQLDLSTVAVDRFAFTCSIG